MSGFMRATLYADRDEDCRPALEIVLEPTLLKSLLVSGETTPEEVIATITRGIKPVQTILEEYEAGKDDKNLPGT